MAVDIGSEAINRTNVVGTSITFIVNDNPATSAGTVNSVDIWAETNITGLRVGIFYKTNGNVFKCRDSEAIAGTITAGSKVTKAVSVAVEIGDYIGCYFTGGALERSLAAFAGVWFFGGEAIDPNDEETYSIFTGDAISLGGYITAPINYEKALSDTISIGDSISKEPGLIKSDSLSIAESLIKAFELMKVDTINITDSIALVADFKRAFADTITISDSIVDVSEFYLAIADTVAIVDAISKEPGLFESDTIAIVDAIVKAMSIPQADTVTINDSISKKPGLVLADSISISDVFSSIKTILLNFYDTILVTDSISKAISMIKSDTISISDVFSRTVVYLRSLSDTLLMTDSIAKTLNIKIILSDIITITDKVKLAYPVRRAVAIGRMTINRLDIGRMAIKRLGTARLPYKKIHEEDV